MITLVSPEIERYAVDHTTALPQYLEDLTRATYERMQSPQMLTGPIEGTLLQFLVWTAGAKSVLEIGTFSGFSANMMAAGLPHDGVVVTCEKDPEAVEMAREYLRRSPHGHKVDIRVGDALDTLKSLTGPFDLVFIDGEKTEYQDYYERALELLSPRGIIVVDNVLWGGRVLDPAEASDHAIATFNRRLRQDPRVKHVLLPVRDGIMLVRRT